MKIICTILSLLFSLNTLMAQDTLYVYKAGKMVYKSEVAKVDSLGFVHMNNNPVADNDNVTIAENASIVIPVLANDSDPDGDKISITGITNPTSGTATLNADGTITYKPATGFTGNDTFIYSISDGNGGTASATVSITVTGMVSYSTVLPRFYYIIGLGDGLWNNTLSGLGKSFYPMSVVSGNKYNSSGDGEFTFSGYFKASRPFKLIRDIGSWNEGWGMTAGVATHNAPDNLTVPADGYYTITLNSILNTLSIFPLAITPLPNTSIGLTGDFSGWNVDTLMNPAETTNNHMWYVTYTFSSAAVSGCKFRANGSWTINWGDITFPTGIGTQGGPNILYNAGTYRVFLNDLNGCYSFIKQ